MSFESKQGLQKEWADKNYDRVHPICDASDAKGEASDLIAVFWICRGLRSEVQGDEGAVPRTREFLPCEREEVCETNSCVAPAQRDWMNLSSSRQNEDCHVVPFGSAPRQTTRIALKSILEKHRVRAKSGKDRLLDLRDF